MTIIDDPPSNISDYVEDVLPLHPTVSDMEAALTKRGFADTKMGVQLTHWVRPVRGGKGGQLRFYSQSGMSMLDYWPNAQPCIKRRETCELCCVRLTG